MNINRQMAVYTTTNRKAKVYQAAPQSLQELFNRLKVSQPIPYTIDAYKALSPKEQGSLKDVGGYVLGELKDGRRRSGMVLSRSGAVLDADNLPAGSTDEFIRRVAALPVCCCVYSTAKHCPQAPRLRVVFPFSEDIPAEQYPPLVRLLCQCIQREMDWFDPTTAEAERMMYYASHCLDVPPVWYEQEGQGLLNAAAMLAQLPNWQDPGTWPRFPSEQKTFDRVLKKAQQQDPESKEGVVGAFCRVYDVPAAMDKFLPGVYEATATEGRYTFTGGSTWGGAVLYDGGKFLYSNHATDPCSGRLVNAFDLVRLHLFGDRDDEAKDGARGNRLPSYTAMRDLAKQDEAVSELMARERVSAMEDFQDVVDEQNAVELCRCAGEPLSLEVVRVALKALGTQVRRNLVTNKAEIIGMPRKNSQEEAVNVLPVVLWDLLRGAGVKGVSINAIRPCLAAIADENRYNPMLDMLHTTPWDGVSRFPALLNILNIDSNSFYALLVRKWLIQCVALAHNSISGYLEAAEGVLVLQGAEGLGKTELFRRLAVRPEWFSEGVTLDIRNKDDVMRAVSVWITELGELDSTLKKEQSSLKAFLTQKVDKIRAPYAAEPTERPRRTSFGATVNPQQFLKDDNGDRRFFVIPVNDMDTNTLYALPREWFIQLWAEVYIWWWESPNGFRLSRVEREHLNELNQQHREMLPGEEEIRQMLDFDLPAETWKEFSASQFTKLFLYSENITSRQTGRVLAKLAVEDNRITKRIKDGYTLYRIPIKNPVQNGTSDKVD